MPQIVLATPRLTLRRLTLDDEDRLLRIFSDPVAMRYYPSTKDRAETRRWIEWNLELYETRGHGLWAAELAEDGAFVGQVGLVTQQVDGATETEVGYLLERSFWGRGFASEAAGACRDWGFETLRAKRLVSLIDPRNEPSLRVAERIGMRRERVLPLWGKDIALYAVERGAYSR